MYKDILLARITTFETLLNEAQNAKDFNEEAAYYDKLEKTYTMIKAICLVIKETKGIQLLNGKDWSTMDIRELKIKARGLKE